MTSALVIPALHIGSGPCVIPEAYDDNLIESSVGLPVATPAEPVSVGPSRGSREGTYPTQCGEGSLGLEALGITPRSDEERCGAVVPDVA